MPKSFRVATEGATTDGREIQREWIEQMAANYDPKTYGARVWVEHIRGIGPDSAFGAMGDVLSLEAKEVDGGKLALFAEIDPTEELKALNKKRQKVYSSIEVNPKFGDTGEAYLEGLAVTDSPASLGTEMIKFSREAGDKSPLASRKQHADNLFTAAEEVAFDFEEEETPKPSIGEFVKSLFSRQDAKTNKGFEAFGADIKGAFEEFAKRHDELNAELEKRPTADQFTKLQADHDALQKSFDELYTKIDYTPDTTRRAPATGGGEQLTDC
ncbi:GPO family capsid scaffolding protein [Vreelandella neptunia]|uniref:GPO family capsid scaffolding protein n=1 Tax=Vreelandella neptunia TaxID=115551 RepID=A0ABZ0YI67_9GAMM|nr:GPO family capsid scaffolding protein [Halomonas neptunia]MDN3562100.1 GPO family capsid scaffolding protein [Halomonas neptunia]WQH11802.1 GPO family capsid scaffolding protein [Halomonas neptunia]